MQRLQVSFQDRPEWEGTSAVCEAMISYSPVAEVVRSKPFTPEARADLRMHDILVKH